MLIIIIIIIIIILFMLQVVGIFRVVIGGNYFLVKLSLLRKEKKIVNSLTAI
jgi:flagellar basal body-associated protein FliL